MPRKYIRKTEINSYSEETLQLALNAIRNDGRKIREVGRAFNIPESTLRKKILQNESKIYRLGRKSLFVSEVETELKQYILTLGKLFYGLTPKNLRHLAFKFAEANNIKHRFNNDTQLAGKDWLYGFLNRNPEIRLRQPEGTSLNRIAAFNMEETNLFYSNLEAVLKKKTFEANRIFNMDETGVTTVQKKCPKVFSQKGAKRVGAATSGERGRTITCVFCMSAAGNYIPPMLIYPRKRMNPTLQKNGPVGALYSCSKNGWINGELYFDWLKHFAKHGKPTADDPVLLVLDNHSSHISIQTYEFCKANHIHVVSLPPHTSHRLQPLDLTFFGPLKNALYREYDLYLASTGHEKITEYDIAELLNKAFMKVATMGKAESGFRSSGIFPFNPNKFSEEDFSPAQELRSFVVEACDEPKNDSALSEKNLNIQVDQKATISKIQTMKENMPSTSSFEQDSLPSTSNLNNSFFKIAPITKKISNKTVKKVSRSKQHSQILTSTPMKAVLEEAEEKRKKIVEKNNTKASGRKGKTKKGSAKTKSKIPIHETPEMETETEDHNDELEKAYFTIPTSNFYQKDNGQDRKKVKSANRVRRRIEQSPERKKAKKRRTQYSDSSEVSDDMSETDLYDDDELDDIDDISYVSSNETPGETIKCGICMEQGKTELWYRCVSCGLWNHAACTGEDSPEQYVCDFCHKIP